MAGHLLALQGSAGNAAVAAALSRSSAVRLPPIQRDTGSDRPATVVMMELQLYDQGHLLLRTTRQLRIPANLFPPRPGAYDVTLTPAGGAYVITVLGAGPPTTLRIFLTRPADKDAVLKHRTARAVFATVSHEHPPATPDPTQEKREATLTAAGGVPPEKQSTPSIGPSGEPGTEAGTKPGPNVAKPIGQPTEKVGGSTSEQGSGSGGGQGAGTGSGSKYGLFGLLDLPQAVVKVFDAVLDAMGDSDEYRSLVEILTTLQTLGRNASGFGILLDPDKLLDVLLGLVPSPLDALEAWASHPPPAPKPATSKERKGLVDLATRIGAVVVKVQRALGPLFKARHRFRELLAVLGRGVENLSLIGELVDLARDPRPRLPELQTLLAAFSAEAGEMAKGKLREIRQTLPLASVERFVLGQHLIGAREIARALTDAAAVFVPAAYKPVYWLAKRAGVTEVFADELVARLIPQPLLDAVNEALRQLAGVLQPALTRINADLDALVDASEAAIRDFLTAELRNALLPVSRSMTTTADQGRPRPQLETPLTMQRSWQSTTTALAKTVGGAGAQVVLGLVKPATKQSADQAVAILKKVGPLVGKPVTNDGKPILPPEAYSYVRDKTNAIIRIRRLPQWAGSSLPKLKIENGRIAIGTGWDWKKGARSELTRALKPANPGPDFQAHHCIPLELADHPIIVLAIKNGWNLNGAENGVWVHNDIHHSSHHQYNQIARRELDKLQRERRNQPWIQHGRSDGKDIHSGLTQVVERLTKIVKAADARGGRLL